MFIKRCFFTNAKYLRKFVLPSSPVLPKKNLNEKLSASQYFVDFKISTVKAGRGGDGQVSFLHSKETEWGGPDGGDGGNGGHVIFKVEPGLRSLNKINSYYEAESGESGRSYKMQGKSGQHLFVKVPLGTILKDENGEIIFNFKESNSKYVVARGGRGGKGNSYFLTNDNKRPKQFENGNDGEKRTLNMELNLIADAALIGYPNVGKSSLLNALTRARPKIGDYSFTTQHPHVGIVEYEDFVQLSIADLPGLLPDSSFGKNFLYHLEKCKIILYVVDISRDNPLEQYNDMRNILLNFDNNLAINKPSILVANKIDILENRDPTGFRQKLEDLRNNSNLIVAPVSALNKINLKKFLKIFRDFNDSLVKKTENLE